VIKNVCVYAASSDMLDASFFAAADQLGRSLARQGYTLVYGGGAIGLMGALALGAHAEGGHVVGVIPRKLREREITYEAADELILTNTMRERKAIMEERGDAFVVLPGGLGTLEETLEILVLKQLKYIDKPLVFLNTGGMFDVFFGFFDQLISGGFLKEEGRNLFSVANSPEAVLDYLEQAHGQ
jgi:uncharacterized protein (TIGR00730 family)